MRASSPHLNNLVGPRFLMVIVFWQPTTAKMLARLLVNSWTLLFRPQSTQHSALTPWSYLHLPMAPEPKTTASKSKQDCWRECDNSHSQSAAIIPPSSALRQTLERLPECAPDQTVDENAADATERKGVRRGGSPHGEGAYCSGSFEKANNTNTVDFVFIP